MIIFINVALHENYVTIYKVKSKVLWLAWVVKKKSPFSMPPKQITESGGRFPSPTKQSLPSETGTQLRLLPKFKNWSKQMFWLLCFLVLGINPGSHKRHANVPHHWDASPSLNYICLNKQWILLSTILDFYIPCKCSWELKILLCLSQQKQYNFCWVIAV